MMFDTSVMTNISTITSEDISGKITRITSKIHCKKKHFFYSNLVTTSSKNEALDNSVEQDLDTFQETYSINHVVVDFRELQSLLSKIEYLIKQTHVPDFSQEAFVIETHSIYLSLKNLSTKMEYNSFKLMLNIESNRGNVVNKEKAKFIGRNPSENKKYNDDELRYLVTCGPNHEILSSSLQNLELKRKRKQCSFSPKWYNDFPYVEYSIKNGSAFAVDYLVLVLVVNILKMHDHQKVCRHGQK